MFLVTEFLCCLKMTCNSERCLKWGMRGHKKLFVGGKGTEGVITPAPPKILIVHNPVGCACILLSVFLGLKRM